MQDALAPEATSSQRQIYSHSTQCYYFDVFCGEESGRGYTGPREKWAPASTAAEMRVGNLATKNLTLVLVTEGTGVYRGWET